MAPPKVLAVALVALVALAGTATAQEAKRDRNLITSADVSSLQVANAYEAVQKLHAEWLRRAERRLTLNGGNTRGSFSASAGSEPRAQEIGSSSSALELIVFVDGDEAGGVESLKRIQSQQIEEIRYLSGTDAQQRYGPRFAAGVIQVKIKA